MKSNRRTGGFGSDRRLVPERPAADVLRDLIRIMHHSFDPIEYFGRCQRVAERVQTIPQLFLGAHIFFRNARTFLRLLARMSTTSHVRRPFFQGLGGVLLRNRRGLEAYVTLSVLYLHFDSMLGYCYEKLDEQVEEIERLGESVWLKNHLPSPAEAVHHLPMAAP